MPGVYYESLSYRERARSDPSDRVIAEHEPSPRAAHHHGVANPEGEHVWRDLHWRLETVLSCYGVRSLLICVLRVSGVHEAWGGP
jgi:hypothetical protein